MANISRFSQYYTAQQRLLAYNTSSKKRTAEQKKLADINGDGKINSKDKTAINKEINALKKDAKLFDFTGDGKVDFNDLNFLNGNFDLDGDGKVSDSEKKFINDMKKDVEKQIKQNLKKEKFTGIAGDGKYYKNGSLATGIYGPSYYIKGDKATGTQVYQNTLYINGEIAKGTQVYKNVLYENGIKSTGTIEFGGILYKNGKKCTSTTRVGDFLYKKGTKATGTQVYKNILYINGEKTKVTQVYKDVLYTEGEKEKSKGTIEFGGVLYKNGNKAKGTQVYNGNTYINGVKTNVTNNNNNSTIGDNGKINNNAKVNVNINNTIQTGDIVTHDSAGRITSIQRKDSNGSVIYSKQYTYDKNGKLTRETETTNSSLTGFTNDISKKRYQIQEQLHMTQMVMPKLHYLILKKYSIKMVIIHQQRQ